MMRSTYVPADPSPFVRLDLFCVAMANLTVMEADRRVHAEVSS